MGNLGQQLAKQTSGLNESELSKSSREDSELQLIFDQINDSQYLEGRKNLSQYKPPGWSRDQAANRKTLIEEVKYAFSQENPQRVQEKYRDLKKSLQDYIQYNLQAENDPGEQKLLQKLQLICKVFNALLRQEERERRRMDNSSKPAVQQKKKKKEMPLAARVGLQFVIDTLLNIVQLIGADNPQMYSLIINTTTNILKQLQPLSLAETESSIESSLDALSNFFQRGLAGQLPGSTDQNKQFLSSIFGMALVRGELSQALVVTEALMKLPADENMNWFLQSVSNLMRNLQYMETKIGQKQHFNWNANTLGPDIQLSNENLSVTRTDSSGWGCQLSEQSITSGIHYVEFKIERNSSTCLLLGVAGSEFSNFSSKSSGPHCYTLQSDGDAYMNERGSGNVFRYSERDSLGMLINMEDKTLTFFHNGSKQNRPPFGPLPNQVYLIACFGGSNQLVSIVNDPEIPDDAGDLINVVVLQNQEEEQKEIDVEEENKEGEEVELFPKKAEQILENQRFKGIKNDQQGNISPLTIATFNLVCFDRLNQGFFAPFQLSERPSFESIKAKLPTKQGLVIDTSPQMFKSLSNILQIAIDNYQSDSWQNFDFAMNSWIAMTCLRLLRSHLFTVLFLQLKEEDTGLDPNLAQKIYFQLQQLLNIKLQQENNQTKEEIDAIKIVKHETSLTLIHGFEIFYPDQITKLDYLIGSLEVTLNEYQQHDIHINIQNLLLEKLSVPVNLAPAFNHQDQQAMDKIRRMFELLLSICEKYSMRRIRGEGLNNSKHFLLLLNCAQKVLLQIVAKNEFVGAWHQMLVDYSVQLIRLANNLIRELINYADCQMNMGYGTILESLCSCLFLSLSMGQYSLSEILIIMESLIQLSNTMTEVYQINQIVEVYETQNPIPKQARFNHLIKIPGAKKYTLKFQSTNQLSSTLELWSDEDKTKLYHKWSSFPKDDVIIEGPQLYFNYVSEQEDQGWKILIEVEVEDNQENDWFQNFKDSTLYLMTVLTRMLIASEFRKEKDSEEFLSVIKNPLFKYGVNSSCLELLGKSKNIDSILKDFTQVRLNQQAGLAQIARQVSNSQILLEQHEDQLTIENYIQEYEIQTKAEYYYCSDPFAEEWIQGSQAVIQIWEQMKQQGKMLRQIYQIGGETLDQLERAVFILVMKLLDQVDLIKRMTESQQIENLDWLKQVIYISVNIRKLAKTQKINLHDQGQETTYQQIAQEMMSKVVIILNANYQPALEEIGLGHFKNLQVQSDLQQEGNIDVLSQASQQKVNALNKLRTIIKISKSFSQSDLTDTKAQIDILSENIYKFIQSNITADQFILGLQFRLNKAISRTIGLDLMLRLYDIASQQNNKMIIGQVTTAFSISLMNESNEKLHYLTSLEGIDQQLRQIVSLNYFKMYQKLLEQINMGKSNFSDVTEIREHCNLLKTLEALSFPFTSHDFSYLLNLNLYEPLSLLIYWAKGQNIPQKHKMQFSKERCITSLLMKEQYDISDYQEEDYFLYKVEGEENSLLVEIKRGQDQDPISQVCFDIQEGFENIYNPRIDSGLYRPIYIQRSSPQKDGQYLTSISQNEDLTINLEFKSYFELIKDTVDDELLERVNQRKQRLRKTSWALFKLLMYNCCGSPENNASNDKLKVSTVQKIFCDQLLQEIKWVKGKERVDKQSRDISQINMKQLNSGSQWLNKAISSLRIMSNIVKDWVTGIYQWCDSVTDRNAAVNIRDAIENWTRMDPALLGEVGDKIILDQLDDNFVRMIVNSQGKLDFFIYLQHCINAIIEELPETRQYFEQSQILSNLPKDFQEAKKSHQVENVQQLMRWLKTKIPSDGGLIKIIDMFEQESVTNKPGLIENEELQNQYPQAYFNSDKQLDLLQILKEVTSDPRNNYKLYLEIKPIKNQLEDLPQSCQCLYTPVSQNSPFIKFVSSILWVIYQCCGSKQFINVISRPEFIQEFTNHMLLGVNEACVMLGYRIMRKVLPNYYDPSSFHKIWVQVPTDILNKFIFFENLQGLLTCLFVMVGYRHSYHMNLFKDFVPNLPKMTIWSLESEELLRSLYCNDTWNREIHRIIESELKDMPNTLRLPNINHKLELLIGIIGFLSYNSQKWNPIDKLVSEWSLVSLKGGSLQQGYIIQIQSVERKLQVYSEEDDNIHQESLNNVEGIESQIKLQFYSTLSQEQIQNIYNYISCGLPLLDNRPMFNDQNFTLCSFTLAMRLKILSYRILNSLQAQNLTIDNETANELAQNLFQKIKSSSNSSLLEESIKYRAIRMLIYNKLKQVKVDKIKETNDNDIVIEISESKEEEDFTAMTEQEENRIIQEMSEDAQLVIVLLKSTGISLREAQAAMKQGYNDYDSISQFVQQNRKEREEQKQADAGQDAPGSTSKCIFKLKKQDEPYQCIDHTGIAQFTETKEGHALIQVQGENDDRKVMHRNFSSTIFRTFNEFTTHVTILVTVGFPKPQEEGVIGFLIGDFELQVQHTHGQAFAIVDSERYRLPNNDNYSFRLYCNANGVIDIQMEDDEDIFKHTLVNHTVYTGIGIGKYGLFLDQGSGAELKGLAVFQGPYSGSYNYWQNEAIEEESQKSSQENNRYVNTNIIDANLTLQRLQATGAPLELCNSVARQYAKFEEALDVLLNQSNSDEWGERCERQMDNPIVEIAVIENPEDLTENQTLVPLYVGGQMVYNYELINRRYIAFTENRGQQIPANYITSIQISNEVCEGINVGNLTIDPSIENDVINSLNITKIVKDKLGARVPVSGLILVPTNDPQNILLPPGYQLVKQDNLATNIGGLDGFQYLFLAHKNHSNLLNVPVTPLVHYKTNLSDHGLVDNMDPGSQEKNLEQFNKIEDEVKSYSQQSLVELYAHLAEIENAELANTLRQYLLNIIQKYPYSLSNLLTKTPEALGVFTKIMQDNIYTLEQAIKNVLASDLGVSMGNCIFKEVLLQFIIASTSKGRYEKLPELLIESQHPYDNNMRYNETVSIPGASALRIEFDPQCHTESGCDILRLYRQPGNVDQICEYSGKSFPDLEIQGDTFYLFFYSDSSCVEWGYRFKVIPIEGNTSKNVKDPLLNRLNIESALWVIEEVVMSYKQLPYALGRFASKEFLHALTLFIHTVVDTDQQERSIRILKFLLNITVEPLRGVENVIDLFVHETQVLYNYEKSSRSTSSLMQKMIGLMAEIRPRYNIRLEDKWFIEFCDAFSLMRGFFNRDHNIHPLLFEQFRKINKIEIENIRESSHPYIKQAVTQELIIPEARYIDIEFSDQCKLDSGDCIYFSYDVQGLEPVEIFDSLTYSEACWTNEPKGPDIQLSNNNMSITRTNSSGWGTAIWSEAYSSGKIRINFKIDNDGRSDYLYIGVFKATGNYSLNSVTNMDYTQDLWMWKTTGEFHRHGEKFSDQEARFRTNDIISLALDMDERFITFIKNDVTVYTFRDIAQEVIPAICFGGSNQKVTIISIETLNPITDKLSKKKLCVKGQQVFYHFPINIGYLFLSIQKWKKPLNLPQQIQLSTDLSRIKRLPDYNGMFIHRTSISMNRARFYTEFKIRKMPMDEEKELQIGLIQDNLSYEIDTLAEQPMCFSSNGSFTVSRAETQLEQFGQGDSLGFYLDFFKNILQVYKNGTLLITSEDLALNEKNCYVWAARLDYQDEEIEIVKNPEIPPEIELMQSCSSQSESQEWGFRFKATPFFQGDQKLSLLNNLTASQQTKWHAFADKFQYKITKQCEEQLVQFIDEYCSMKGVDPLELNPSDIVMSQEHLMHYRLLEQLTQDDMRDLIQIIQQFNIHVQKILHLVSLDISLKSAQGVDELQHLFLKTRGYIFEQLKRNLFNKLLEKSKTEFKPEITIDRTKAIRQRNAGKTDQQAISSVFAQVFREINHLANRNLRNSERIFKANFQGEGSTDAGGPYNEVISTICDELQSRFLPLFVPTQNNVHNIGEYRDGWIINPSADQPLYLELFTFLGKMMGVAIRTQNNMNLTLPPLFWKRLVIEDVDIEDLKGVDECADQILRFMQDMDSKDISVENFESVFGRLMFTAQDSSGRQIPLIPNGADTLVTYTNAKEYSKLALQMRLNESQQQYSAIRKGMSAVVPLNLLNMFSWRQVENMICGAQDIDVEILKEKTSYEGYSAESAQIKIFWEVLKEITQQDRSLFLRFVWGRSRLPVGKKFKNFKITLLNKSDNPDNYLPVAHTCFFQLDLPMYSCKEVMRSKLLYAITHCQAIDLDRAAQGGWGEDDD